MSLEIAVVAQCTPLYTFTDKFVRDEWVKLEQTQITPWAFFLTDNGLSVKTFYGQQICYRGIRFEGSPALVFWSGYIEPFLEDISYRTIAYTATLSKENGTAIEPALDETRGLLAGLVARAYRRMSDIDQNLRGCGFPDNVKKRNVSGNVESMNEKIAERIASEIALVKKPKQSFNNRFNKFYEKNQFWFWLITIVVGSVLSVLALK